MQDRLICAPEKILQKIYFSKLHSVILKILILQSN